MTKEDLFKRMRENSIGSEKRTSNRFNRKRVFLKKTISAILSAVIAFSMIGCVKNDNSNQLESMIEYSQLYEDYGYTDQELCDYEIERLDSLLESNGMGEYTRDEDCLRNYDYTAEDYKSIEGLDDSYLYAMYLTANQQSVDEFSRALGYNDLNDYLESHGYVDDNGYIDGRKWYRDNIMDMAKIKYEEDNSKGMSL